jgi:hypothetical protein
MGLRDRSFCSEACSLATLETRHYDPVCRSSVFGIETDLTTNWLTELVIVTTSIQKVRLLGKKGSQCCCMLVVDLHSSSKSDCSLKSKVLDIVEKVMTFRGRSEFEGE